MVFSHVCFSYIYNEKCLFMPHLPIFKYRFICLGIILMGLLFCSKVIISYRFWILNTIVSGMHSLLIFYLIHRLSITMLIDFFFFAIQKLLFNLAPLVNFCWHCGICSGQANLQLGAPALVLTACNLCGDLWTALHPSVWSTHSPPGPHPPSQLI